MKKRIFIVLFGLLALIPLGLLSDAPAWGEWDSEYYSKILGFTPKGIESANSFHSPLLDYTVSGTNDVLGYYISAFVGIAILFGVYLVLMKILKSRGKSEQSS
jgi:cobalt/nickel transport protein